MKKVINNDVKKLARAIIATGARVLCLSGDLGAGKTTLTQAICEEKDVKEDVVSPTFSIVNVYADGDIYHADLYRIDEAYELDEIGFDEMLYSDAFVVVEWADRFQHLMPDDALWVELGIAEDGTRYAMIPDEVDV